MEGLDLTPILRSEDFPVVIHGTYRRAWDDIRVQVRITRRSVTEINIILIPTNLKPDIAVLSAMKVSQSQRC